MLNRRVWTRQPQGVNPLGYPFDQNCELLVNAGVGTFNAAGQGGFGTVLSAMTLGVGAGGRKLIVRAGAADSVYYPVKARTGANPFTILYYFNHASIGDGACHIFIGSQNGANIYLQIQRTASGSTRTYRVYIFDQYAITASSNLAVAGKDTCIAVVYDGATLTMIVDGLIQTPHSNTNLSTQTSTTFFIGSGDSAYKSDDLGYYLCGYWSKAFPVGLLQLKTLAPYSIFAPLRRPIFATSAADAFPALSNPTMTSLTSTTGYPKVTVTW